jgi:hypothetical protein
MGGSGSAEILTPTNKGKAEERFDIAQRMKAAGMPTADITRLTGLSHEQIESL